MNSRTKEYHILGMQWLNDNQPFFTTLVTGLGEPVENPDIPTAMVVLNKETKNIEFHMNPNFFANLSVAEIAGVLTHETYHVFLNHLSEALKTNQYPDSDALLKAHEVIINDALINELFILPEGVMFGPDLIGLDCSRMSTQEAYNLFENKNKNEGENNKPDGTESSSPSMDGEGVPCGHVNIFDSLTDEEKEELLNALENLVQDIVQEVKAKGQKDDAPENLDELLELTDDSLITKGSIAGNQGSAAEEMIQNNSHLTMDWVDILLKINPKMGEKRGNVPAKHKYAWDKPRRKIAYAYPKLILPTTTVREDEKGNEIGVKPTVLLALDFSGSIPRHMKDVLGQLARSIPDELIEVKAITFSTYSVPFDYKSERNKVASGGTDFGAVEKYARKIQQENKNKEYPYVICMTDGEALFSNQNRPSSEQLEDKWFWLGTSPEDVKMMKGLSRSSYSYYNRGYYNPEIFKNVYPIPYK